MKVQTCNKFIRNLVKNFGTNKNYIYEENNGTLNAGKSCNCAVQNLLCKNLKVKTYSTTVLSVKMAVFRAVIILMMAAVHTSETLVNL
jgi:hypothetical protein